MEGMVARDCVMGVVNSNDSGDSNGFEGIVSSHAIDDSNGSGSGSGSNVDKVESQPTEVSRQKARPSSPSSSEVLGLECPKTRKRRYIVTTAIFFLTLLPALVLPSLEIVLSLTGAVSGSFLAYIMPSVMWCCVEKDELLRSLHAAHFQDGLLWKFVLFINRFLRSDDANEGDDGDFSYVESDRSSSIDSLADCKPTPLPSCPKTQLYIQNLSMSSSSLARLWWRLRISRGAIEIFSILMFGLVCCVAGVVCSFL